MWVSIIMYEFIEVSLCLNVSLWHGLGYCLMRNSFGDIELKSVKNYIKYDNNDIFFIF